MDMRRAKRTRSGVLDRDVDPALRRPRCWKSPSTAEASLADESVAVKRCQRAGRRHRRHGHGGARRLADAGGADQRPAGHVRPGRRRATLLTPKKKAARSTRSAGTHPFQLTSTVEFNQTLEEVQDPGHEQVLRPLRPRCPRISASSCRPACSATSPPPQRCSDAQFAVFEVNGNKCPAESAVGVASVTLLEPSRLGYRNHRRAPVQPRTRPRRTRPLRVRGRQRARHAGNRRAHRRRLRRNRDREQRYRGRAGPGRPDHLLGRPRQRSARQHAAAGAVYSTATACTLRPPNASQHRAIDVADLLHGRAVQLDGRRRPGTGSRSAHSSPSRTASENRSANWNTARRCRSTDDRRTTDPGSRK